MGERRCLYCQQIFQPSKFQRRQGSLRRSRLPAPSPRRVSPRENRRRSRIPRGLPGQSPKMALPQSRLLEAVSAEESRLRRPKPPAAATPGPEASPLRSCKQHLSSGPKAFRRTGLARRPRRGGSCKQQLSSGANLGDRSTSAPQAPAAAVLQTTTCWCGCRSCRCKPCSGQRPAK